MTRCYAFIGGNVGPWRIESIRPVIGESLALADRLDLCEEFLGALPPGASWLLRGVVSNTRYTNRREQDELAAVQPIIGRADSTCAALIAIMKSATWWALSQDERREIIETRSAHIATGLRYLPAVARRLHHSRDLGEPFNFLAWFEFAPANIPAFEELLAALRSSEEWTYVSREVDIRLALAAEPRRPYEVWPAAARGASCFQTIFSASLQPPARRSGRPPRGPRPPRQPRARSISTAG